MNRDEILKAVQSEKAETGEYERSVAREAVMYGALVGVILCTAMLALELWVFKKMDFGKPAVLLAIYSFADFYEGRKCKGKRLIIKGVVEFAIAVFFLLAYIGAFIV